MFVPKLTGDIEAKCIRITVPIEVVIIYSTGVKYVSRLIISTINEFVAFIKKDLRIYTE